MTRRVRFTPFLCAGVFLASGAGISRAAEVPFAARPAVSTGADGARAVAAADFDRDGDLDVASASSIDGRLAWYENTGGDGSAWTTRTIAVAAGTWALAVADVDGDGDADVLSTGPSGGQVLWHENAGNGTTWTTHTVASGLASPRAVVAADVDRDGHVDVVVASGTAVDGSVVWYENAAGNGSIWTPHTVSTALVGGWAVAAGDVDGDGDLDLFSASRYDDTVAWYENLGGAGASFTRHLIGTTAAGASAVQVADVDRDGDLDVLAVSTFDARLLWYSNDGGSGTTWTQRLISPSVGQPLALYGSDLDGDGDVDALSASQSADTVVWAENLGAGAAWALRTVATGPDNPLAVAAADLDGDGDADVLSASFLDDRIGWFRNETIHRNACFRPPTSIAATGAAVTAVVADVDGDGAQDVAWGSGNQLAWERNLTGAGDSWGHTAIAAIAGLREIEAGDLDREGDLDLVAFSAYDFLHPRIDWYEQPAAGSWASHPILPTQFAEAGDIDLGDIDGDGDLDVMSTQPYGSNLRWLENAGDGTGWVTHALAGLPTDAVALADVDGDGDLDAYVNSYDATVTSYVGWRANLDGLGGFSSHNHIYMSLSGTLVFPADLDGDGDADLVTRPGIWLKQAGSAFASVPLPGVTPEGVAFADFDRDGDLDLVKHGGGSADWAENLNGDAVAWGLHALSAPAAGAVFAGDLDGDGDADLGTGTGSGLAWRRNDGGQASITASSAVPANPVNGQFVPVLRLDVAHLGRAGDSDLELASLGLLFEETPGDPLATVEANALIANLYLYRDANGNGVFDPATDTLVATVDTLALTAGLLTLPLSDADPNVQVAPGSTGIFFVVAELTADASTQTPSQFLVTHLAAGPSASRAEDRTYDLTLSLACPSDVASAVVGPITPVELERFTIE